MKCPHFTVCHSTTNMLFFYSCYSVISQHLRSGLLGAIYASHSLFLMDMFLSLNCQHWACPTEANICFSGQLPLISELDWIGSQVTFDRGSRVSFSLVLSHGLPRWCSGKTSQETQKTWVRYSDWEDHLE